MGSGLGSAHRNRWLQLALGLTISGVCLWLAVRGLLDEPDALQKTRLAFTQADYRSFVPIILATCVFYWFKALRWRLLLKPVGEFHTLRDLFPYVMIGFGFNNLLPVHLGEVLRVLMFTRHARVQVTTAATSVVLERIFDSVSVLTLLTVGLVFEPKLNSPSIQHNTLLVVAFVSVVITGLLLYVLWTEPFIAFVTRVLSSVLSERLLTRVRSGLETGAAGLGALKSPRLIVAVLALSMGNWLVNAMVIHLALWSFGLPASLLISCIVLGLTAVGAAVPSAPGYFGVIQLCFMTVLTLFTPDEAGILAASIYYHLTEYTIVTLVGLYYFSVRSMHFADLKAAIDAEEPPSDPESLVSSTAGSNGSSSPAEAPARERPVAE